jgi:hypothetical protein
VVNHEEQIAGLHREIAGVMANPLRIAGVTCQICTRDIEPGYTVCWQCNSTRSRHLISGQPGFPRYRTADLVVPLTYMIKREQAYFDMFEYKDQHLPSGAARRRLSILTTLFGIYHASCLDRAAGVPVTSLAVVPSLQGRIGQHPLDVISGLLPSHWARIPLHPGLDLPADRNSRRDPNPSFYRCDADLTGHHVVLFDDTWVSGGHAQGAAVCVRNAGAGRATVLVLARMLEPSYSDTAAAFVKTNNLPLRPYELTICPVTGGQCPP